MPVGPQCHRRCRAHDEGRNQADHLLQLSRQRADELRVVIDHACHDLLGDVESADVGTPCARATEQNSIAPPAARTETVVLETSVHPPAVHAVVRLLKVEESEAPLAAVARGYLLEPVHLLEVEEHVVGGQRPSG